MEFKESLLDIKSNLKLSFTEMAEISTVDRADLYRYCYKNQKPHSKNLKKLTQFILEFKDKKSIEIVKKISQANEQDFIAMYLRNKK